MNFRWSHVACAAILASVLSLSACSYRPEYSIGDVQPPASLDNAIAAADAAKDRDGAGLSIDDRATTLSITRDGAVLTAIARNRSLRVQRFDPAISRTFIAESRAEFDPELLATATFGRTRTRPISNSDNADSMDSHSRDHTETHTRGASAQVDEYLPTGTALTLAGGVDRTRENSDSPDYEGDWSARVTQSLLRGAGTDVNLVDLRQARNNSEISVQAFRDNVMELVRQVEDAYWNLVLARETLRIREAAVELADEQKRLADAKLHVGSAIKSDVLSAIAELSSRNADLVDARAEVDRQTVMLIRLLSPDTPGQWNIILDPIDPPEIADIAVDPILSTDLALKYRPDIAQSKLEIENSNLEVVRTKNGLLPRLDGFVEYGRRSYGDGSRGAIDHLDENRYDEYAIGADFQFSPINRAERARNKRAKFEQQQANAAIANLKQLVGALVRQDIIFVNQQRDRITATKQALDSRREQLRAITARYRVGSATILDTLQVQNDLIQSEVDEVTARIRYIQSLTALYRDEATLLDRRKIGTDQLTDTIQ